MLTLRSSGVEFKNAPIADDRILVRLTQNVCRPRGLRPRECLLLREDYKAIPDGFRLYACFCADKSRATKSLPMHAPLAILPDEFEYLAEGDIISIEPKTGTIRTLYRKNSLHNSFLVTERCNHYCLMCSQPPRNVNDDWLINEIIETIKLADPATKEIGLTGGEPTLLGDDFIRIIKATKAYLPCTAIHVLSNGRRFASAEFADAYASVRHDYTMVGIPIYSDSSTIHNYIVQADGAFDETVRGILNLKQRRQRVEIRVVIHQQTYKRLPHLAKFIARNLAFVDQVSLMGLEITGFTKANLDILWIDPIDYQDELRSAVFLLERSGINVVIFNHQLCTIEKSLWPFAVKSISDWKNEYMPECDGCTVKADCGGFFSSAKTRYSDHIRPILNAGK